MFIVMIQTLTNSAHADPIHFINPVCPRPCLQWLEVDAHIVPSDTMLEWDRKLQPVGMQSLLLSVTTRDPIGVELDGVVLGLEQLIAVEGDTSTYQVDASPWADLKLVITAFEYAPTWSILIDGSSEAVR